MVALEDQSREHKEKHAEVNKLKDGQEDDGSKRGRIWEDEVAWGVLACAWDYGLVVGRTSGPKKRGKGE